MRLPDDVLREHAYLVARGVRPLALLGDCESEQVTMTRVAMQLEAAGAAEVGAIPFVIDRGNGTSSYGFAARRWVVDLYEWWLKGGAESVPREQAHRIEGLLFGYDVHAIAAAEEQGDGRRFRSATESLEPGASRSAHACEDTAGTALLR